MQQNDNKSILLNGILLVGGLLALKFLLGVTKIGFLSTIALAISLFIIYILYRFATRHRDNECEGSIQYGRAFIFIFRIYFLGSVISSLIMLFYTSVINKDYLTILLNDMMLMFERFNFPIEDNIYSLYEAMYKPLPFATLNLFSSVIVGTFWGLILAAFVKKDKTLFD